MDNIYYYSRREFIKITGLSSVAILCSPVMAGNQSKEEHALFEKA